MNDFTLEETERYSRQIMMADIGGAGQAKLKKASVLVIGAGGLGSPVLSYLAAAGIGTLGIVEHDVVDLSNLQRQTHYSTSNVGNAKLSTTITWLEKLNPHNNYIAHDTLFADDNYLDIARDYSIIIDGSDNIHTRLLTNKASIQLAIPLISGAVRGFEGQLSVFEGYAPSKPCYCCLYPDLDPDDTQDNCIATGIVGATAGVIGSLMTTEALKLVTGGGETLSGKLLLYNGFKSQIRTTTLKKDPKCSCSL